MLFLFILLHGSWQCCNAISQFFDKSTDNAAHVNLIWSWSCTERNILLDVNIVDKKQIKWFTVLRTLINNNICHQVLKICYRLTHCTSWVHNILTTVMTNIIAVKSRDHTKPQLIWYILYIDAQDKCSGHAQLLASCNGFQKGIRLSQIPAQFFCY